MVADPGPWLRSVRRSHDRVAAQVRALSPADLGARSYSAEWTIADVLSHLGSQAEIFSLFVDAGLGGGDAPDQSAFQPVWDSWNSRAPGDQAAESVIANERLVSRLENLEEDALRSFRLDMFG
ncbi:MAG TPA: maleylpyruvate isomerase N-terminal domain-containing protein, partial [Acidimicrobiales bacterium]|nr:maleylpyruvate isomerase N-terminal domain-containing protein [Acidimicrobiales bacterium]